MRPPCIEIARPRELLSWEEMNTAVELGAGDVNGTMRATAAERWNPD